MCQGVCANVFRNVLMWPAHASVLDVTGQIMCVNMSVCLLAFVPSVAGSDI